MSIEAAACELGSVGAAVDNCTHSKLLIPGVSKHHPHSSIKGKLLLPFEAPRGVPVLRCSISAMLYTYKRQGQPISSGRKPFIEDQYILKLTTSPYIRPASISKASNGPKNHGHLHEGRVVGGKLHGSKLLIPGVTTTSKGTTSSGQPYLQPLEKPFKRRKGWTYCQTDLAEWNSS